MGGNWEKSRWDNRFELRSSATNRKVMACRFGVSAAQTMIRSTLGVKGSQVQILSSRRPRGSSQVSHCEGPLL